MTQQKLPGSWILPQWPAPARVRAIVTSREGGYSSAAYASFNLSDSVGDNPAAVLANRAQLASLLDLPTAPVWLQQVHGNRVVDAGRLQGSAKADAACTDTPGVVCAVTTADCLPVLFCNASGSKVAVAHAGWRGLASGVLEATVETLNVPSATLHAWLGPAIGQRHFEVGDEVREAFVRRLPANFDAFMPSLRGRWLADLYQLARNHLRSVGVVNIYGGGLCTYSDPKRFYSYRWDRTTGRMASLIWMARETFEA